MNFSDYSAKIINGMERDGTGRGSQKILAFSISILHIMTLRIDVSIHLILAFSGAWMVLHWSIHTCPCLKGR